MNQSALQVKYVPIFVMKQVRLIDDEGLIDNEGRDGASQICMTEYG